MTQKSSIMKKFYQWVQTRLTHSPIRSGWVRPLCEGYKFGRYVILVFHIMCI